VRFSELEGARVGVWGAGREIGSFADQLARRLPATPILVAAFDVPPDEDVRETLKAPNARVVCGSEVLEALSKCEVVVRSPGVPVHRPELGALRESGAIVTTATALWLAERGGEGVIGVTGTKGKSTTAALLAHLAREAGQTVALAGNIGAPALDLLDAEPAQVTVVELSSYHIADLEVGPQVALVTNLFREHTDWHGSEENYRTDKLRLLDLPGVRVRVLNGRDPGLSAAFAAGGIAAPLLTGRRADRHAPGVPLDFSVEMNTYGVPDGWNVHDEMVLLRGVPVVSVDALPLRGVHNALNLCGALAALEAFGVSAPPLPESLAGFRALPHRLEPVAERNGVLWVNDSVSTTPESTLAALASFPDREVVLIAGGQDRGQDYAELGLALAEARTSVIGVPSTGPRLLVAARAAGLEPARTLQAAGLEEAVRIAGGLAGEGAVVLLSPAAPSYDHYRDFEERGERFRALAGS